jgi:P-type Cu2+ transporter
MHPHEHGSSEPVTSAKRVEPDVHGDHEAHAGHTEHADHAEHAGHAGHADHASHAGHDPAVFRRKFWLSAILTVPTMLFSPGLQEILGLSGPRFPGSQYIPAIFGIAIFLYGGLVFLRGAVAELRAKQPGMMTLIALAIVVALGYSLAVTLGVHGMDFWWELATLITIMLLGHWIEMSAVMGARDALGELAKLLPDEAERVYRSEDGDDLNGGDRVETVAVSSLEPGALVLIRPGASVPVDGVVVAGGSEVDESLLTGESVPVEKTTGDAVVAGSISGTGSLTVRVTKIGGDTALAGIMRMVADAQSAKSGTQLLADRAAGWLFYVALAAAALTLLAWSLLEPNDPGFMLERVVTVLIIACPHALGLAIPLVAQIATTLGARNGLLIRSRSALEESRNLDVVLFDKTGTLTEGKQGVTGVYTEDGVSEDEVLSLAASVEAPAEHPIGRAIVAAASERGIRVKSVENFRASAGRGVTGVVAGRTVSVAAMRVLIERAVTPSARLVNAARDAAQNGMTVVYVVDESAAEGAAVLGMVALADVVRPESAAAVKALQDAGVRVAMVTGDSQEVAASVAATLGITEVLAEVLPDQKAGAVAKLQSDGSRVAMVGDGVNDAPALAQANVGIAIGAGTDVAIEAAGIVLASSDPRGVARIITLSHATYRKMQQNLFWATGYNVFAIPLAAGALSWAGLTVSPALGAVLMSVSTVVVALNAQLLRRLRLR